MAHNLTKGESLRRKAANCRTLARSNPTLAEPMIRLAAEYEERAVEADRALTASAAAEKTPPRDQPAA